MSKLFAATLAVAAVNAQSSTIANMPITQRDDGWKSRPEYVGEVVVGESNMQVRLDTTTHLKPVASSTCDYCWENGDTAQGLDLLDSLSAGTGNIVRDREDAIHYGGNWMDGRFATDQICIGDNCLEDQVVFVVEDEELSEDALFRHPFNAAIGLARPNRPFWALPNDNAIPDPADFLLNQNTTGYTNGFEMHYRKANTSDSSVTFGASDLAGEGAFMNILDDYFWSANMEGAGKYGAPIHRFANSTAA